jgi:hypothetical protein
LNLHSSLLGNRYFVSSTTIHVSNIKVVMLQIVRRHTIFVKGEKLPAYIVNSTYH